MSLTVLTYTNTRTTPSHMCRDMTLYSSSQKYSSNTKYSLTTTQLSQVWKYMETYILSHITLKHQKRRIQIKMRLFWHVFLVCSSCYNKNTTNWVAYKQLIFISQQFWRLEAHSMSGEDPLPGWQTHQPSRVPTWQRPWGSQDLFHKNGSHLETCFSSGPHEPWAHSLPHGTAPLGQVGESIILVCLGLEGIPRTQDIHH